MKHIRVFRTLTLAIILALLMIAITVTPALAASVTLSPVKGEIGTRINVGGSGFTGTVYIYFSSQEADTSDYIDDLDVWEEVRTTSASIEEGYEGTIDTYFNVPDSLTDGTEEEDVHGGDYFVYTTQTREGRILTVDEFTVIGITIDPVTGVVGTEVEITGSGFDGREDITIKYDGKTYTGDIEGDKETDSGGEFTCTIAIPASTKGDHTINVVDESRNEGEAVFTVVPKITISPASGKIGDSVTVSGTGFVKSKGVTITFDGDEVATDETDTYGSFEADFKVPEVAPGSHDMKAEDASRNSASAKFTITTSISISPVTSVASPGHVGSEIIISGTGFKANHEITITYESEPVTFTITSEADGSFSYTFKAPPSLGGTHTITASDGTSSMQVTFVMESTPPEAPQPLLPYMSSKSDSKTHFDWEDVIDDSKPVTYDLQVATDKAFTASSMVLERTGLTTSEYTLTEAEKLESTGKDAPYYWRLRAVDSASNVSEWTGAGEFYVGFIFGIPKLEGWVLYAVIGAAAIVLFFLGFWVGRRGGGGGEY